MPQGFFTPEELEEKTQIEFDFDQGPNCQQCGLFRKCQSPKMKYTGEGQKGVLIIAEAAGQQEDQNWRSLGYKEPTQLIGDAGQLLRQELGILKLDLDRDFWKVNAVNCRPQSPTGANRPPTKSEIKYCKPLVDKTIRELNPKMIWLMGGKAVESMYIGRFSKLAINRWRKLCIPDRKTGSYIIPLFHPSYILRNDYDENLKATFKRDLKWAASCIKKESFTWTDEREDVVCLYDFDQIISTLQGLLRQADDRPIQLFLDYETNALKPQWPGAKIASIALCVWPPQYRDFIYEETGIDISMAGKSVAFPYQYSDFFTRKQQTTIKVMMRKLFQHKQISWIAQNIKFEDAWTRIIFGVRPYSWQWDTMLASHIEDNRSSFTGLKFQSYVKFGLEPYNKEVEKYLKAKGKDHFNSVDKAPLDQLLLYNGLDTKMTAKLWQKQMEIFTLTPQLNSKNRLSEAYQLFHKGTLAFSDMQMNGICIGEEYYKKEDQKLTTEIIQIRNKLKTSKEAAQFQEETNKELDFGSTKDLGKLFYEVLGLPAQRTDKKNYRVDVDALENIKLPFVDDLRRLRKLEKVKGTYMSQLLREVCDGRIYPFFDLHIPKSFRGSSSSPNFQNIPIRDPEIGPLIRSGIIPSPGCKIMEADFSQIEVRIAAVYTSDPTLIAEATMAGADMHTDTSLSMWNIPKDEMTKEIRNMSKTINFLLFYGGSYKKNASNLWKQINTKLKSGITLKEHISTLGINDFNSFEQHCKEYEYAFWYDRFSVYRQWKEDINKFYIKYGYVENKLGFRFTTAMNDREVSNYPIQSTAFHCLLTSVILLNDIAKKEKWKSKIIGQIHDSVIITLFPEEEDHIFKTCSYIMSHKIREMYDWITVPLPIEIECSNVGESWAMKKEIKIQ